MNVRQALRSPSNFNIRLEYSGKNYENVSNRSNKFWACRSNGDGTVTVTWGRMRSEGTSIVKPFSYFVKKVSEKLNKGYVDTANPYGFAR
jgi:predicted DNA-binding WGR domain protein